MPTPIDVSPCINTALTAAGIPVPPPNGTKIKIYIGTTFTGSYGIYNSTTGIWTRTTTSQHGAISVNVRPCLPSNPTIGMQIIIYGETYTYGEDGKWHCGT